MNNYELTVILGEKTTPAKKKAFTQKVEKLLKVLEGKVIKTDDWGKQDFCYKIDKQTSGNYLFFKLELQSEGSKALADKLRMDDEVVRHLLLRV